MIKALAAMLFSVLLYLDAGAQQSTTQGWLFGLDLGGAAVSFENRPSDRGALVGGRIGYGFNRILTLYFGVYGADVDIQDFDEFDRVKFAGHYNLGVRLHLANSGRRWVPYGDLAFTHLALVDVLKSGEQDTIDINGAAFSLGGGLAIHLSEAWALDVNFKWSKGEFKNVRVGNNSVGGLNIDAESAGFTVGVLWWP